jgi:hypothetical protein
MVKTSNLLVGESIDLANEIAILNRPQTPLTSLLMQRGQTVPAEAVKVEWREKTLNANNTPQLEGDTPATVTSDKALKDNYCMIISKKAEVSGTVGSVTIKGIPDVLADEVNDRLIEVKRDIEYYSINGIKTAESGTTPRQMAGLLAQIHADNVVQSAVGGDITADLFLETIEKVWQAGVMGDYWCVTNSTLKKTINGFATNAIRFDGTEQVFGIAIEKYVTDFGNVFFLLSNLMPVTKLVVGNIDFVELAELRRTQAIPLAKTGDSDAMMVVWEGCLKLLNSKAWARFEKV